MRIFLIAFSVGLFTAANAIGAMAQSSLTAAHPALTASGKVVGPNDQPQAGIPIEVVGPAGRKTFAITDQEGMWSVYNLPAGTYEAQPMVSYKSGNETRAKFTVKDKNLWQKLFGHEAAFVAPDIKIAEDFRK